MHVYLIVQCAAKRNYLRQVNKVNGGDNVFVRCVSIVFVCLCVCVCAQRTGRS